MTKKFRFMAKEGESVTGATRSSQDLAEKISKIYNMSDEDWEEFDLKAASTI